VLERAAGRSYSMFVVKVPVRSILRRLIPTRFQPAARKLFYLPADSLDLLLGRRDPLTPPKGKIFFSVGDFKKSGEGFVDFLVDLGGLRPSDTVLDVGCGIGRRAVPLTEYLDAKGSYEGIDIVPEGIEWCNKEIAAKFSNFRFTLADVHNKQYHPAGKSQASEYVFPYKDDSFDFTFLASVFTHMLPEAVDNYLSEIARVLRNGGRSMITFFLLNRESLKLMESGVSTINFKYDLNGCRVKERGTPEVSVAYPEGTVRALYKRYGLEIEEPIRYGSWCGRREYLDYQDIVVASKQRSV
jgi:ubiquinone/menaquinone biosynthesis C-methylase UbiE